jgi:hypothetical protein
MSLLEEVMRITPHLMRTQQQNVRLVQQHFTQAAEPGGPTSIEDLQGLVVNALRTDEVKSAFREERRNVGRQFRDLGTRVRDVAVSKLESISQMVQRLKDDGVLKRDENGNTTFGRVQNEYEKIGPLVKRLKEEGFKLHGEITRITKGNKPLADRFGDTIMDSTFEEVDFTAPAPAGLTKRQKAVHAKVHAEFKSWPQELQNVAVEMKDFFAKMENRRLDGQLMVIFENLEAKAGTTFPAGLTTAREQTDWVMDGGIRRAQEQLEANAKATGKDVEMYRALDKKLADDIADAGIEKVKGFYFPAYRRGDDVVSGHETIKPPEGATLRKGTHNVLDFRIKPGQTKADVRALIKKAKAWRDDPANPRSTLRYIYIDPTTGKVVPASHGEATRVGATLKVHNDYVEFFHSRAEAQERRAELIADTTNGFTEESLGYAESKDNSLFEGDNTLAPQAVRRMLDVIDQRVKKGQLSENAAKLAKWELVNSAVRGMAGSARQRKLKRRGVEGASTDIANGLVDYSGQMASAIGRLERSKAISEAEKAAVAELEELGGSRAKDAERKNNAARRVWEVMQRRYKNPNYDGSGQSKFMQGINALSFMNFLWTPQYWATNTVQPGMTAMRIGAEYGTAAMRHMVGAYHTIGGRNLARTLGRGLKSSVTGRDTFAVNHMKDYVRNSGEPDAAQLVELMEDAENLGRLDLDIAGQEIERQLRGKPHGRLLKAINAVSALARAMPKEIEAVNRTVSMIASYRAARNAGLSHEQAKQKALDITSETQFDYRPENRADLFNLKGWGPALMFKQYGQAMMHLQVQIARNTIGKLYGLKPSQWKTEEGREARKAMKQAGKLFAGLAVFHWFFAGLQGAFPVEGLKLMLWFAHYLGATDDDDSWDERMLSLRKWFAKNYGKTAAEVLVKGPVHALGIDLSNSIQQDSILLFKGLEKDDKKSVMQLVGEQFLGAPFAMIWDVGSMINAAAHGDFTTALKKSPFKPVKNIGKALEGAPSSPAGEKYAKDPSLKQSVITALGFKPSKLSDEQTVHFAKQADKKATGEAKNNLYARLRSATPGERAKLWSREVVPWNREHPKDKITRESYQKSVAAKKARTKKDRKEQRELEAAI